jgi:hypothetical protein
MQLKATVAGHSKNNTIIESTNRTIKTISQTTILTVAGRILKR